ncbi:cysteine desulfurase family protein [Planctomicrobium sp. SH668]|uniref:cysteine desulfurase family protein n=1 Tax=Planctomicrobium sp. SH668 TaxID=3448126 RepID=UPI003F5B01EA
MIYLDNNATTMLDPEVLDEMNRVALRAGGNPGSRHLAGRRARQVLEDARESIASILCAQPKEVVFTSGGTESNNLAIFGLSYGRTSTILLPAGEHPAIEEPAKILVKRGWSRAQVAIHADGRIDQEALRRQSFEEVGLATALLAHNETGVIQDLKLLAQKCQESQIPFHIDAVQAVGKIEVDFSALQATTLSAAAHKFHGPRGVGILLVRTGTNLSPMMVGGFQEQSHRPGTEPVMLAAGMSFALSKWARERAERQLKLARLRDRLQEGLTANCSPIVINGNQEFRLPNTLHIAFPGCDADALLVALDLANVCCSLGSACASGSTEPSPILMAMGCPAEVTQSSVRFSVSTQNTESEIDSAIEKIVKAVQRQRSLHSNAR